MKNLLSLQEEFIKVLTSFEVPKEPKELYEPLTYTLANGGKRTRPLLVLIGCKIFNDDIRHALNPALAVELFHNFTLLHDDIMDDAPLRRGKPTVHQKWNTNVAILSGDVTLVVAYQHLVQTRPEAVSDIMGVFSTTAAQICEGQQMDMNFEERVDVLISDYLEMIKLKTAVLLGCSLKIGAIAGGATAEQANHLYDFGLNLGIAFQLQDDILDVYGSSEKVGKQKGGDIVSNKKTFLLLKTMETADENQRQELQDWLSYNEDDKVKVEGVAKLYHDLDIRNSAEQLMHEYFQKGMKSLSNVDGNKDWIEALTRFSNDLMKREN